MNYSRWNNLTGWAVFAVAAVTYLLTMEPSASLWDCSEFIATSYKLEVGHPPGAPLFMLLARIATMLAPSTHYVPHMVNALNSLGSAFCILFLFWTITHIARRMFQSRRGTTELSTADYLTVLGAGAVGALAYTFTDTFWFSAVEGEVYSLSSMFTAMVVWLMLKWEEQADQPHALRWIVLIAYSMGLSIGIHILNLLTIPALVFIYYFRTTERVTLRGVVLATLAAGAILLLINGIIIPYTVLAGGYVDLFFVNTLGLPINSGMVFFVLALFAALGYGVYRTHCRGRRTWNVLLLSLLVMLIGYSSYASMTIRAVANPPMNSNNPNNPFALYSVLNRDQYGQRPLLYGPYYSAPILGYKYKTARYIDDEGRYASTQIMTGYEHPSEFMHLFPRLWNHVPGEAGYKPWAAYRTRSEVARDERGEVIRDEQGRAVRQEVLDFGRRTTYNDDYYGPQTIVEPTFAENLNYFFTYQLNYMYWRYFMWNFVGRQNDIQATDALIADGNWLSGIHAIDALYLGPQVGLPDEVANHPARNTYYFLPFLLGLIGMIYQFNRDPKNFSVVLWLFIMMGIALVVYFNSSPGEPRERDYIYAGSFYAFCMWIGLGVLALRDLVVWLSKRDDRMAPTVATLVALAVPGILVAQNWDDHDRSGRTIARDIGWNYLQSTLPNSIVINYGDNDTFPLWFNQEVDGVRTDVRLMNSSYLGAEWYVDEMRTRANEADGVPFSLPREKYTFTNDILPVEDYVKRPVDLREAIDFVASEDPRTKLSLGDEVYDYLPTHRFALPVNKENALTAGIVKPEDRDLMVDTLYLELDPNKHSIDKSTLMLLDMLATFDWTRPIYFTQSHIPLSLGLIDYLQFDGYAYRLVPIHTPVQSFREVGRIDPEYAAPLLLDTFRYGNFADPKVFADYTSQHCLNSAGARSAFARVAKELLIQGDTTRSVQLLDRALEVLPTSQLRYTEANTVPLIEGYYYAGEFEKGDRLLIDYARNLMQYIDHYLLFDGIQGDMVTPLLVEKLDILERLYYMSAYVGGEEAVLMLNDFYRSLGATEEELIHPSDTGEMISPTEA